MEEWKKATEIKHSIVEELKKIIPQYSYADEGSGKFTDEKICDFLVKELRKSKSKLFDIINFLFEVQEERMDKEFVKFRDEIDIFSDEIKIHRHSYQPLKAKFLLMLIEFDKELIDSAKNLNKILDEIYNLFLSYRRVDHKIFDTEKIEKLTLNAKNEVKKMIKTYKKRELLLKLELKDLERTFAELEKKIETSF